MGRWGQLGDGAGGAWNGPSAARRRCRAGATRSELPRWLARPAPTTTTARSAAGATTRTAAGPPGTLSVSIGVRRHAPQSAPARGPSPASRLPSGWPWGRSSCALLADRTVRCWGDNRLGGLGDGTRDRAHRPPNPSWALTTPSRSPPATTSPAPAGPTVRSGAGASAVRPPGRQRGRAALRQQAVPRRCPRQVGGPARHRRSGAGRPPACAARDDGALLCLGRNFNPASSATAPPRTAPRPSWYPCPEPTGCRQVQRLVRRRAAALSNSYSSILSSLSRFLSSAQFV